MFQICVNLHIYGDGHCIALIASLGIQIKVAARKGKNRGGQKKKKIFLRFYSILQSSQALLAFPPLTWTVNSIWHL